MTQQEKDSYNAACDAAARKGVPKHLLHGLALYLVKGINPGDFMTAVLENNLKEACATGDENSLAALVLIVRFLYNDAPAAAWGSKEKVSGWKGEASYNANR